MQSHKKPPNNKHKKTIYLFMFPSTLSVQSNHDDSVDMHKEVAPKSGMHSNNNGRSDIVMLEERLQAEMEERGRLELELEKLRGGRATPGELGEQQQGRRFSLLTLHAICCSLEVANEDRFSSNQVLLIH